MIHRQSVEKMLACVTHGDLDNISPCYYNKNIKYVSLGERLDIQKLNEINA